jgi:hypothetical protein
MKIHSKMLTAISSLVVRFQPAIHAIMLLRPLARVFPRPSASGAVRFSSAKTTASDPTFSEVARKEAEAKDVQVRPEGEVVPAGVVSGAPGKAMVDSEILVNTGFDGGNPVYQRNCILALSVYSVRRLRRCRVPGPMLTIGDSTGISYRAQEDGRTP